MIQSSIPEVLTLEEVAGYLRIPTELAANQAASGRLPGRQIGDTWRFLRTAIDDWLRSQDARTVLLQQAGALSDDVNLASLCDRIYKKRKNSASDEDIPF